MANQSKSLRLQVFLPTFLLILLTIVISFVDNEAFISMTTAAKSFMLAKFGWLFSITGLVSLLMVIAVYVSPLGALKIGGKDAKPMMGFFAVTSIVLCTTIAAGILFWGTAEPLYHYAYPPASLGIEPKSPDAARFALETLFLHWTFIPYAIYFVQTAVFAFAYYNMKRPFSIGSQVSPLLNTVKQKKIDLSADIVILFAITFAMASSFATSVVNVGSGLNYVFGIENSKGLWAVLTLLGTIAFVISAGTGLFKGIKYLSQINAYVYTREH
ncbi:MAG: BCCT family transporter [Ostreibacterium sp.]